LLVFTISLSGCAYYNYLYNANKRFEEGEKQRRDQANLQQQKRTPSFGGSSKRGGSAYERCIESAGRMLEYYPDSKYEPDALLLLAKAYYRTEQYRSAITKVDELTRKHPDSPLLNEALVWKGMSLLEVAQTDSAILILSRLSNDETILVDLRAQAFTALADYYYKQERWEAAQTQYRYVMSSGTEDEWMRGTAQVRISDCLNKLNRSEEALSLYEEIIASDNPRRLKYLSGIERGVILRKVCRLQDALDNFDELLDNTSFLDLFPRVELERARVLRAFGRYDSTRTKLEDIVDSEKRGDVAVEANWELGDLLWTVYRDGENAKMYLTELKSIDRSSPYTKKADSLVTEMGLHSAYWARLRFYERQNALVDSAQKGLRLLLPADTVWVDSTKQAAGRGADAKSGSPTKGKKPTRRNEPVVQMDPIERMVEEARFQEEATIKVVTAGDSTKTDSTKSDSAVAEKVVGIDSLAIDAYVKVRKVEKLQTLFEVGTFHYIERNDKDSAGYYFGQGLELISAITDSATLYSPTVRDYWAKTLTSQAFIAVTDSVRQDSLYHQIAELFPDTPFGIRARLKLGLDSTRKVAEDSLLVWLQNAEQLLTDQKDLPSALSIYSTIVTVADTGSTIRAQALLAMAFISSRLNPQDTTVAAIYTQVKDQHANTPYAKFAQSKMVKFQKGGGDIGKKPSTPKDQVPAGELLQEEQPPPDQFGKVEGDSVHSADKVDDPPKMETTKTMLDLYLSSNYPFEALGENLRGSVELEFTVGIFGDVYDMSIVKCEPEGRGFEDASFRVMERVNYRAGRHRGQPVAVKLKQKLLFVPEKQ